MIKEEIKLQGLYKSEAGRLYQVITLAKEDKSGKTLVIYQAMFGEFAVLAKEKSEFINQMSSAVNTEFLTVENKKSEDEKPVTVEVRESASKDKIADNEDYVISEEAEHEVSKDLLDFLDAETYEEQRNILIHIRPRITDHLIDSIAAAMDVSVDEGDLDKRYNSLLNCIKTKEKYEILDRR